LDEGLLNDGPDICVRLSFPFFSPPLPFRETDPQAKLAIKVRNTHKEFIIPDF